MVGLSKKFVLMLLVALLVVLGVLLLVGSCVASETKPATPLFTIEEISSSYDVPPTSTTDPYTGETTTYPGYTVENKDIYIKIKNQPFTQPNNGLTHHLYYQYRYKGHYSNDNWYLVPYAPQYYVEQSDSEYTLIPLFGSESRRGQVDIEVRALIGVVTFVPIPGGGPWSMGSHIFSGDEGDWSNTVVVSFDPLIFTTLSPSNTSPTTTLPPPNTSNYPDTSIPHSTTPSMSKPSADNPSIFGLASWVGIALVVLFSAIVVLLAIIAVVMWRKNASQFNALNPK